MNSATAGDRLDTAFSLLEHCRLCPRRCGAARLKGETGFCGEGRHARLFMEYVHWAEDAIITPAQTLYLCGCNLACSFCQTREERGRLPATRLTPELFQSIQSRGRGAGAVSVNILGGEPGVNLPALFEVFAAGGDFPGLVWNTNLYIVAEACALLDGVADLYLGDIKFGCRSCAGALSGRPDAGEVAWERAAEIHARSPQALVLRHLVVPGHFACCTRPVLEGIAKRFPGVPMSLKTVYMPPRDMPAGAGERRFLAPAEAAGAIGLARELGLRLTADADWAAQSRRPGDGGSAEFELVIAPDGGVYLRHALGEALDMVRAVVGPGGAGQG